MSYTVETLTYDVFERLKVNGAPLPPSLIPRIATLIPSALRLLPIRVRERFGDSEAELYRKNYTVALTSGSGSLAAHADLTSEPLIPSEIVKVTHPSAVTTNNAEGRLQRVGSETGLNLRRSKQFAYYAIADNTLYTMKDNSRTTLGSNATVRGAFPPLIASVKFSHEPILVECVIELAQGLLAKAA